MSGNVEMAVGEMPENPMSLALSPELEKDLEQLSEDKRKSLLMWYLKDQQGLLTQSEKLQAVLDGVTEMDASEVEALTKNVDMKDAIRFMLLNEFGDKVAGKPLLETLVKAVEKTMSK